MNQNFFPENLRFLRAQNNESQASIGKLLGKRSTAISSWEQHKSQPSIDDLLKLADYFLVYVGDLIGKKLSESNILEEFPIWEKGKVIGKDSGKFGDQFTETMRKDATLKRIVKKGARIVDRMERIKDLTPDSQTNTKNPDLLAKMQIEIEALWSKIGEMEDEINLKRK